MKTLLSCDAVFDRLTRGPFPSGAAEDQGVESHLEVCYECRQLAEALRPAVNLFHDAADEATLPAYRGRLPQATSNAARCTVRGLPSSALRMRGNLGDVRYALVLAAVLLLGFLGGIWGSRRSEGDAQPSYTAPTLAAWRANATPEDARFVGDLDRLTWSLSLPNACRSGLSGVGDATANGASSDQSRERPWQASQHCCTLCHSAQSPRFTQFTASRFVAACLVCHKG